MLVFGKIDLITDEEGAQCIIESKINPKAIQKAKNKWNTQKHTSA